MLDFKKKMKLLKTTLTSLMSLRSLISLIKHDYSSQCWILSFFDYSWQCWILCPINPTLSGIPTEKIALPHNVGFLKNLMLLKTTLTSLISLILIILNKVYYSWQCWILGFWTFPNNVGFQYLSLCQSWSFIWLFWVVTQKEIKSAEA